MRTDTNSDFTSPVEPTCHSVRSVGVWEQCRHDVVGLVLRRGLLNDSEPFPVRGPVLLRGDQGLWAPPDARVNGCMVSIGETPSSRSTPDAVISSRTDCRTTPGGLPLSI